MKRLRDRGSWRSFASGLYAPKWSRLVNVLLNMTCPNHDRELGNNTINKIINNNGRVRLNRVGGWVVGRGSWVVGRGSCLFEDKKKEIYISSLSALSKFAIARINFPELLL